MEIVLGGVGQNLRVGELSGWYWNSGVFSFFPAVRFLEGGGSKKTTRVKCVPVVARPNLAATGDDRRLNDIATSSERGKVTELQSIFLEEKGTSFCPSFQGRVDACYLRNDTT